jgi:recombination protein RecA
MAKPKKEVNPEDAGKSGLELAISAIDKKFGRGMIFRSTDQSVEGTKWISSGCLTLDRALGGGYPRGKIVEVYGNESAGKAQPLTSQILTPKGWVSMSDLEIGSIVCTPDGGETTVIGIFPQGRKDIYKITLDDQSTTYCTAEHLWLVYTRGTQLGEVISTQTLINTGLITKNNCRKFYLPTIEPLKFNKQKLPLDPYLLGLLLGDGSFRDSTIKFSTLDTELLESILYILNKDFPGMCISKKFGQCDYSLRNIKRSHKKTALFHVLKTLGLVNRLSPEKFIPEDFLLGDIYQRTRLLQGLMDTDGSVEPDGSTSFSTSSKLLSRDFQFLARSLGFRCVTSSRITKYRSPTGKFQDGLPSFRSSLLSNSSVVPVHLKRKLNNLKEHSTYRHRFIVDISPACSTHCQCIKVSHPDQLYITDDFIPTHNTTLALHAVAEAQKIGLTCAFVDAEHALDLGYARKIGVNVDKLLISQPASGEDALDLVELLTRSGEIGLIIIDSVAALTPRAELEGEMGDSSVGRQALMMSKAMRKLCGPANTTETTLFFINQLRMKITMFGNPETTAGGQALKFYASQRLDIRRQKAIGEDGKEKTGVGAKVKVVKNKVAPPFCEVEFIINFSEGIDWAEDLYQLCIASGLVVKQGASFLLGEEKIGYGMDSFKNEIRNKSELATRLKSLLQ